MKWKWSLLGCCLLLAATSCAGKSERGLPPDEYRLVKEGLESLPVFAGAKVVYRHDQHSMVSGGARHDAYLVRIYEAKGDAAEVYRHYARELRARNWQVREYAGGEIQGREADGSRYVFVSPNYLFPDRFLQKAPGAGEVRYGVTVAMFSIPRGRSEEPPTDATP